MKYLDSPSTEVATDIEAPPRSVWALVTDIELPARFSSELQRVEWLDGASGPVVGASFAGHNRHPVLGDWRTVSYVAELEAERVFGWVVVDADGIFGGEAADPDRPMARWRFVLEPQGGGTAVRISVRMGPARSGLNLAIDQRPDQEEALVQHRLRELGAGMTETLTGLKALAELRTGNG